MQELMNKRLDLLLKAESMTAERPELWRVVLKQDLQDLLFPEEINWMEDDGNISDKAYLQRVLDDATAKFARYGVGVLDHITTGTDHCIGSPHNLLRSVWR